MPAMKSRSGMLAILEEQERRSRLCVDYVREYEGEPSRS